MTRLRRLVWWWRGLPASERPVMVSLALLYVALGVAGIATVVTYT